MTPYYINAISDFKQIIPKHRNLRPPHSKQRKDPHRSPVTPAGSTSLLPINHCNKESSENGGFTKTQFANSVNSDFTT